MNEAGMDRCNSMACNNPAIPTERKEQTMRLIDADKINIPHFRLATDRLKMMDAIDNVPSIDIVRCGECIHNGSYDTDCPFGWKDGEWNMPKPCDFCSYGERNK